MTGKHTPGPWVSERAFIFNESRAEIAQCSSSDLDGYAHHNEDTPNAARIVACVNACEGINPDAVPEMLDALEQIARTPTKKRQSGDNWTVRMATHGAESRDLASAAIAKAKGDEA